MGKVTLTITIPLGRNGVRDLEDGSPGPTDRLVELSNRAVGEPHIQLTFKGVALHLVGSEGETEFPDDLSEPQYQWLNIVFDIPQEIQDDFLEIFSDEVIPESETSWSFDHVELKHFSEFDFEITLGGEDVSQEVAPRLEWLESDTELPSTD